VKVLITAQVLHTNMNANSVCLMNLLLIYCRQQALFHVLAAYSMYNTEVGYCQGMSQIAAILLMYLNEEVAAICQSDVY